MRVQPLPPALLEKAVDLWRRAGLTGRWNDPQDHARRALAGPSSTILADFDGETLIATAMVGHDGHRGWVYYLAVAPEAQGQGHGRRMMQAREAWLVDRHVPKVNLMVRSENTDARSFTVRSTTTQTR